MSPRFAAASIWVPCWLSTIRRSSPFERNWRLLRHLRETAFQGRRFVLTSPNAEALARLVGRDEKVYEILDDGGDLDAIVQAVREAARARPTT